MIALIPARSGSKGLPNKNKKLFAGKPLIQHSIEQALESTVISEVFVSTDDDEIIELTNSIENASAPFKRAEFLSEDTSSAVDVYLHFVEWWENNNGKQLKEFAVLLPTSPLRLPIDIKNAVDIFHKKNADVVLTFKETKPIAWHRYIDSENNISKILDIDERQSISNRQQINEKPYVLNGSIYVFNTDSLRSTKNYFVEKTFPYIMPSSRSIDIDSLEDFTIAEAIFKSRT